ncbi:MAG: flavin reductase [Clostridia bacterium]|nr:flavin reductase [Clostridia bacterium]
MEITKDIRYIGVNDHRIDLFEGQYRVPNGMAYNSYVILDEKTAVMDTVDAAFTHEWLDNLASALGGRKPDYLVVQHMEPDHSANILKFAQTYPQSYIVANAKAFAMIDNFFGAGKVENRIVIENGGSLSLGKHTLNFVFAPMVHWPEVTLTYESSEKVLFSADAFGKFGANDIAEPWDDEARRYYIGIVGKYGAQVQSVLKKAAELDIETVCPLHGPVLHKDSLAHVISLYDKWSSYTPESEGIVVAYTSVYGHTAKAAEYIADKLRANGCPKVVIHDLARTDMSLAVADAFRYGTLVLATTTYNAGIFPFMREFIEHLTERNFRSRKVALIENGSWAPLAAKIMKEMLSGCKDIDFSDVVVSIRSAMTDEHKAALEYLAKELCSDYTARSDDAAVKNDMTALYKIGYGLYAVTCRDGEKDNGLIVNTVSQVADNPNRIAVTVNKANYSNHIISRTGVLNVNCLSTDAPFSLFQSLGFRSGRNCDKFEDMHFTRSDNGLVILPNYINAMLSLKVEQSVDLGSHTMFICSVTEARVMNDRESMTYAYYHANVKPKPQTGGKKGYVCKICGYVYEGDTLPEDFVCPLCKHGAADFEPIT